MDVQRVIDLGDGRESGVRDATNMDMNLQDLRSSDTPLKKTILPVIGDLNLGTLLYPESQGGLMICGYEWGGGPEDVEDASALSFFSDLTVKQYVYRTRLLKWFNLWGCPLSTRRGFEGPFERAIVQTNWMPDQARSTVGRNLSQELFNHRENFFTHLEVLRPRVLIFCGKQSIFVLNEPKCLAVAESILGARVRAPEMRRRDVFVEGVQLTQFVFGFQSFARCEVIGLPHPSGSRGLEDAYVAAFRPDIEPILWALRAVL